MSTIEFIVWNRITDIIGKYPSYLFILQQEKKQKQLNNMEEILDDVELVWEAGT